MLTNLNDKHIYQGNGSNKNFAIVHDIILNDQNETLVYIRDETIPSAPVITLKTFGALQDYTLTGANPPTTPFNNNVLFSVAPTASQKVIVARAIPLTELLNLLTSGTFDYSNINTELMRIVAMLQLLNEKINRSPQIDITSSFGQMIIPEPVANTVLGFDATPNPTLKLISVSTVPTSTETQVTVANGTIGQALTDFSADPSVYSLLQIDVSILRKSANGTLREKSKVILSYDDVNSVWRLSNPTDGPDMTGVTFNIVNTAGVGTITFDTDTFSLGGASYVGKLRYKVVQGFLKET